MSAFETWWHNEGSGMPPLPGEDAETHTRRVCKLAWYAAVDSATDCITEYGSPRYALKRIKELAQ